jgi:hypothetical protein
MMAFLAFKVASQNIHVRSSHHSAASASRLAAWILSSSMTSTMMPARKRHFFELSLCLSRACLGKRMHFIYKWRKKCRFLTDEEVHQHVRRHEDVDAEVALRKNGGLFVSFPLCLSRACLVKMFVFMYKWLKKTVLTHRAHPRKRLVLTGRRRGQRHSRAVVRADRCVVALRKNATLFSTFRMFVPSLSW